MSTDREAFVESLASVDVASSHVPPADVPDAIGEFVVGDAVGIPDDAWSRPLPASVNWEPTPADLWAAETGVTATAFAIADYGSLVVSTNPPASELVSLYVDRHVVIVEESAIVSDMEAAFDRFGDEIPERYRDGIIATGPSATADMGALVKGAHGPSEVRVVVVEE